MSEVPSMTNENVTANQLIEALRSAPIVKLIEAPDRCIAYNMWNREFTVYNGPELIATTASYDVAVAEYNDIGEVD